ncbi:MAG: magnesium chelatase subunit H [Parvularculaceae bacterium]
MPKRATPDNRAPSRAPTIRVVLISLDSHLSGAVENARQALKKSAPSVELAFHAAADWSRNPASLEACRTDIGKGDIIVASMLFLDEHIKAIQPALEARREACDAMVGALSAAEIVKLTRLGAFRMDKPQSGPIALLKRLRGKKENGSSGSGQMKMLRQLPKLLKFIPGTAQDVRAYFLTLQYWLAGSEENIANLVRYLVDRYAAGPRASLKGTLAPLAPKEYPDTGVYHPRIDGLIAEDAKALPRTADAEATVGLLIMRSYALSRDAGHYDGVIAAFEAKGVRVIPAFASGLDQRPAIEKYFMANGRASVDAVVSLTGFSLVGGPAYNDTGAAQEMLARLDVPYIAAHALEFQNLPEWAAGEAGLSPVEATIMVAIPELDGAIQPTVFGGRVSAAGEQCRGCARQCAFPAQEGASAMRACPERAETLASRVSKLVALRRAARSDKKIAVVLFNFPPNAGATGSAAFLGVFESLFNTLSAMKREGYSVEVPPSVDALREAILKGNAERLGTDANVADRIPAAAHVRREPYLKEIEAQWGPSPGRQLSNGSSIFVLGARFGNIFVGVQPGFGYEGDPMRLLFERGFAPTHAFSAFYRYLREDFGAHAVLHFGTHGALEFMPGKQTGLSETCWPDRLIGNLPNFYLYAANNPTEGALAKRRSGATLISHLTPAIANAGLYRELSDLKASIDRWRLSGPDASERDSLAVLITEQRDALGLAGEGVIEIADNLRALEQALIPDGLHVVGQPMSKQGRADTLTSIVSASERTDLDPRFVTMIVDGATTAQTVKASGSTDDIARALIDRLVETNRQLSKDSETPAIIHALDGGYIAPAPGGDLIRTPEMLPTGRNIHGFDPFRMPSAFAMKDAITQSARLLGRHLDETGALPETVAIVLWGADNMKSEGAQLAQALALMGARPRFDSYGRLCGASLAPLSELGRPRIDVMATLSGIFRDLLPLQTRMLAEAALLAAKADETDDQNFVRKHALACMAAEGCDIETAALRVFSNATGAYGANVNQLIDSSGWTNEDELAESFTRRKCFAYGANGAPAQQPAMLKHLLSHVDVAYQNLESVELGVTTIDHYFDTLGGIGRAVKRAKGTDAALYIADQTSGAGAVRTLSEQVSLETHTRTLNPKWYEGMLRHGFEGVRQIEASVTNTMGWSATTGEVPAWVYQKITETYVLDKALRDRLATLNPKACARVANRLLEASDRKYWLPDPETLAALTRASEELEDRLEGVTAGAAA